MRVDNIQLRKQEGWGNDRRLQLALCSNRTHRRSRGVMSLVLVRRERLQAGAGGDVTALYTAVQQWMTERGTFDLLSLLKDSS